MKKNIGMVVALLCLACSAMAESRMSPFAAWMRNNDENAFGGGLKYEVMFSENFGVDARASFLTADGISVVPLLLGITGVLPQDGYSLFASAGGGYFIPDGDEDYSPDAAFGFYVGGGLRAPISENVDFFAEVDYINAESEKTETTRGLSIYRIGNYTLISSGTRTTTTTMDLSGPAVSVGIAWKF